MQEASARDWGITSKDVWRDGPITGKGAGRDLGRDAARDTGKDGKSTITISRVRELFQSQEFSYTHILDM